MSWLAFLVIETYFHPIVKKWDQNTVQDYKSLQMDWEHNKMKCLGELLIYAALQPCASEKILK